MEPARLPLQSAKRQRSISSLSAQQVQQKRDLDRKAQRAMRERTKARIQVLEDDLARLKASCSQGEQLMLAEIQYLRDQNQRLKSSLESIGRFAFEGISQSNESIPTQKISTGSNTAVPETASTLLNSSDQGTGTQNRMSHAETARQPRAIPPVGGNDGALEQDQQPLNPINSGLGTVAGDASSSGDPEILVSNLVLADDQQSTQTSSTLHQFHPTSNVEYRYTEPSIAQAPTQTGATRAISRVLPKHTTATCPLDQILLDFIISRRSMIARGDSPSDVSGPEKPSPAALLTPELEPPNHPIVRVMTEVLGTFPHVQLAEKIAFIYLMHLTTRWQISPSDESYASIPVWLRPTAMQITVPHPPWIDNIPWPRVRDMLIDDPDRYPFVVFSELYSMHVSINWPYEAEDAAAHPTGGVSIFEKHIQRLSNWTVSPQFQDYFPELIPAISGDR